MIFLKVNETKELAFENTDKIDNSQVRLTKEKRNFQYQEWNGISYRPYRHQKDNKGRERYKQSYTHEFDNSDEVDHFIKKQSITAHLKLDHLKSSVTIRKLIA